MKIGVYLDPVPVALYEGEKQLRDEVLRRPLGMVLSGEDTAHDGACIHFLGVDRDAVVACALGVRHGGGAFRIRQMAVSPERQGQGAGAALLRYAEQWMLREEGAMRVWLNARHYAVGFYQKCGYRVTSDAFIEVGMPHYRMEKPL